MGSGLKCLQIRYDVRDLIRIEPELGHGRMVGNDTKNMASELKKQAVIKRDGKKDIKPSSVDVLQRDYAAVKAALTLPWSNGPVEGHINRLRSIYRTL